jgi:hypothetical protein
VDACAGMRSTFQDGTAGFGALQVGAQFGHYLAAPKDIQLRGQISNEKHNFFPLQGRDFLGYNLNNDGHGHFQ